VGTQINIIQIGAGQVTIQAASSGTTTVSSTGATPTAPALRAQYSSATLIKAATDLWYVVGDIS
jgi:guanyl-specific ribonuclease Sa